ncbi:hypothetical protein T09_7512 [Trichinella sp. T9]|nr:hypothetical protein T09_1864 [Trichinella sp. T9]KRX31028.1 hypothetical protein T09_7512 [Trichinella sp. T9]
MLRNWLENMAVFYGQFKRSPTHQLFTLSVF